MMFDAKLISADSHVDEPLSLWQERLPVHLRHKAPHIESARWQAADDPGWYETQEDGNGDG